MQAYQCAFGESKRSGRGLASSLPSVPLLIGGVCTWAGGRGQNAKCIQLIVREADIPDVRVGDVLQPDARCAFPCVCMCVHVVLEAISHLLTILHGLCKLAGCHSVCL